MAERVKLEKVARTLDEAAECEFLKMGGGEGFVSVFCKNPTLLGPTKTSSIVTPGDTRVGPRPSVLSISSVFVCMRCPFHRKDEEVVRQ